MLKKILIIIFFLLVVLAVVFFWRGFLMPANEQAPVADNFQEEINGGDPANCVYSFEGEEVIFKSGKGELNGDMIEIYSLGPVADMDFNGGEETVVIFERVAGDSTSYYISLAANKDSGYEGAEAILLGEDISSPSAGWRQGIIIANYIKLFSPDSKWQEKYFAYEADGFKELDFTKDSLKLLAPSPASYVSSPLTISGQARGSWYFEAVFPVTLVNWDGLIIAEGQAQAQSDWMTEDFVPFSVTLNFTADTTVSDRGWLILKKDNPSGLPENDDYLEIPIFFE